MRKQEYIHVHALLVEVIHHLDNYEDMPTEMCAEYTTLNTRPWNVHASKQDHHEAVMALTTAIETWFEQVPDERLDQPVAP